MLEKLQHASIRDLRRLDPVIGRQIKSIADPFRDQRGQVGLFDGTDGNGKTLAAQLLGNLLGYPAYRVDLSAVVSKYIGETEKNLDRVFEAAESSDIVLLLDEADALFGKRSEVDDARDRYANQETGYLLQRLEAFEGVAVLTTNSRDNIDDAFLRRLNWVIDFPRPETKPSRSLWERIRRWLRSR